MCSLYQLNLRCRAVHTLSRALSGEEHHDAHNTRDHQTGILDHAEIEPEDSAHGPERGDDQKSSRYAPCEQEKTKGKNRGRAREEGR